MSSVNQYLSRNIHDLKVAKLATDCGPDDTVAPNTLTYDTLFDVPGVSSLNMSTEFSEDELRGDGGLIDVVAEPESVTGSIVALLGIDSIVAMLGGRKFEPAAVSGKTIYRYSSDDVPGYFYLEGQIRDHNTAGDVHLRIWKARITSMTIEYAQQTYSQVNLDYKGIGTLYKWTNPDDANDVVSLFFDIERNGTAVAVNTVAPLVYV